MPVPAQKFVRARNPAARVRDRREPRFDGTTGRFRMVRLQHNE